MYKLLLSALFVFIASSAQAQNSGLIKGKVLDSVKNEPLELSTVAIVDIKDSTSSLVSYTTTDKKGLFALHNLPVGIPLKVLISFVGYRPYRKLLTLKKGEIVDLGTIILNPNQLNEVTITGERPPIVIKKDTIEFAAEAFKTRPNAVVEELLKKLPGIEVDNQGNIMFNGKKVNKILIDGREFFAQDIRIASKNLDAEMIDKVQVYDDRENDPDHLIEEARVEKIINLKFKKKLKKSVFGKVYAGAGTEGRYESAGLFNMFRDTLQISLLGLSNNLSNTGFGFNDLYQAGGVNRGGDAITRGGGYGSGVSGIQQTTAGGANINTDYGKKLKLNVAYYYTHNDNNFNSISNKQQFLGDTVFTTNSSNTRQTITDKHTVSASIKMQPNTGTQISYTPIFSYTDNQASTINPTTTATNFLSPINVATNTDNNSGNSPQFQQSFSYNKQLKTQGASINIDHNLQISPNNSNDYNTSNVTSYITSFPSYSQNRYGNNLNKDVSANISVGFRYPVSKKLTLSVSENSEYLQVISRSSVFDFDPVTGLYDSYLLTQSNDLTRNQVNQNLNPGITYAVSKTVSLTLNENIQLQHINNEFGRGLPDQNVNDLFFLPTARLSWGSYTKGSYAVGYSESVQQPNIGDLIPYSIVFSPLYSVTGNPNLKPGRHRNFTFNFNAFKTQSQIAMNAGAGFSLEQDGTFRKRTLDSVGAETSTPINRDGRYTSYINGYLTKRFKKSHDLQLSATLSGGLNQSHSFFEINRQDGYQNTFSVNASPRLSINWKDIVTSDPSYTVSGSVTDYTGVNYANVNLINHNVQVPFEVFWPKRVTFEGSYTYTYTPLVVPGYKNSTNLLSLSVARQFLKKDQAEIKLSCYDILNQAISSSRSVYENTVSDTQSQIINRYFMITLRWKFNSSKYEEKKDLMMGPMMRLR